MTTAQYMKKYGVKETIIIGRPDFTPEYQEKWREFKKELKAPTISTALRYQAFVAESAKHTRGIICYRVDLEKKIVIEEIHVALEDMDDFGKKNFRESVKFTDLKFDEGKPIK